MRKVKYLVIIAAIASLSSCGIFKKDCHCPHFGKNKSIQQKAITNLC
jgi:hypothetical protein